MLLHKMYHTKCIGLKDVKRKKITSGKSCIFLQVFDAWLTVKTFSLFMCDSIKMQNFCSFHHQKEYKRVFNLSFIVTSVHGKNCVAIVQIGQYILRIWLHTNYLHQDSIQRTGQKLFKILSFIRQRPYQGNLICMSNSLRLSVALSWMYWTKVLCCSIQCISTKWPPKLSLLNIKTTKWKRDFSDIHFVQSSFCGNQ